MSKWIKVSERLPEEGIWVIFCNNKNSINFGYLTEKWYDNNCFEVNNVTHWQNLPELPTESED